MLWTALGFAVLLALCAGFASLRGVSGSAAPLLALCGVMLWFSLAVIFNVLVAATWVLVALAALWLAFALWRRRARLVQGLLAPGFLIFTGLALVLLVYFAIRQPVFVEWDEFSFWGPAAKLLMQDRRSYAVADTGFFVTMTQRPGLIVLNWLAQLFSPTFVQWKMYWAYDLLMIACACALLAPFERKHWRAAVPLALAGLLAPFFFSIGYHTVYLAPAYVSVYGDVPAGMLFGAALALYFAVRRAGGGALWQAALPLAALTLVKDNVVPMAMVAAGIMAADCLFFGTEGALGAATRAGLRRRLPGLAKLPVKLRGAARRVGAALFWPAVVLAAYIPWSRHAAWAARQNPLFGERETNMPLSEAMRTAFEELFGLAPQSAPMQRVLAELKNNFVGRALVGEEFVPGTFKVSMAGSPLATLVFLLIICAVALVCLKGLRPKLRAGLSCLIMAGGYAAYHFVLITTWAIFSHTRLETGVVDYGRYLSTYNIGWFMLGLGLLGGCALRQKAAVRPALARAGALAVALFMVLRFAVLVRPGYSALDFSQSSYAAQKQRMATATALSAQIEPGSRVFFVCQGENGGDGSEWMAYHLYLLPTVLDYSITGGWHFVPPELHEAGISAAEMRAYLEENGLQYILIDKLNDVFVEEYGGLFEGGLDDWQGAPAVYKLGADGLYAKV